MDELFIWFLAPLLRVPLRAPRRCVRMNSRPWAGMPMPPLVPLTQFGVHRCSSVVNFLLKLRSVRAACAGIPLAFAGQRTCVRLALRLRVLARGTLCRHLPPPPRGTRGATGRIASGRALRPCHALRTSDFLQYRRAGIASKSPNATGRLVLLFSFQFAFFFWSMLGLLLLFSLAFIFLSCVTHGRFSLVEDDLRF